MIQKMKNKLMILATLLALIAPAVVPVVAYATPPKTGANSSTGDPNLVQGNLCSGSNFVISADQTPSDCSDSTTGGGISGLLKNIVNIISAIVGVVAVIMIIVGGFKYITSGGDSNNVSGAKNTIIYAIIGLVIVALAQVIVHFVLSQATGLSS